VLAFTFPGQGSQRPGMGASWRGHPSFELVDIASEIVGRDVTALLLDADEETLRRTQNAQLATFVSSLVVLDAAERLGLEPFACAGHSLGEYSALVATGSLGYDDGLRLVAERGSAMQDAADDRAGTMMAVLGLDDDDVEAACVRAEGEVWIANYNAPGQVVIAGEKSSLERAAEIAKSLGAKRVLSFPVGVPSTRRSWPPRESASERRSARSFSARPIRSSSPTWMRRATPIQRTGRAFVRAAVQSGAVATEPGHARGTGMSHLSRTWSGRRAERSRETIT